MIEVKTFVIVGGGTAGWLTALIARQSFPQHNIVLVESEAIGILGAGEGSTPHLPGAFAYLGISLEDLVRNTSCTLKNGIMFDNWSETKRPYLHGFEVHNPSLQRASLNKGLSPYEWTTGPMLPYLAEYAGIEDDEIDFLTIASQKNKVLFSQSQQGTFSLDYAGIDNFINEGSYGIHFDARSLAEYMSKVAQERRVKRIEGKVAKIEMAPTGNIGSVLLESGESVKGDFFFDCTGFARLINEKFLGSEWVSLKETLPANRAMPFFLDTEDKIPPYTLARAMDRGWMWKIPLQHRFGCGYVYDADQISDDEVKQEIDRFIGHEVEVPRIFKFDPGYVKSPWIKNSLAVGLANGFVEPLEATSIMQLLFTLQTFFGQRHKIFSNDTKYKENFNAQIRQDHEDIAKFIYLHYMTDKNNNDFWSNFTENYKMPEGLVPTWERFDSGLLNLRDDSEIFDIISYTVVAKGNGLLTRRNVEEIYRHGIEDLGFINALTDIQENVKENVDLLVDHKHLLSYLGAEFE